MWLQTAHRVSTCKFCNAVDKIPLGKHSTSPKLIAVVYTVYDRSYIEI